MWLLFDDYYNWAIVKWINKEIKSHKIWDTRRYAVLIIILFLSNKIRLLFGSQWKVSIIICGMPYASDQRRCIEYTLHTLHTSNYLLLSRFYNVRNAIYKSIDNSYNAHQKLYEMRLAPLPHTDTHNSLYYILEKSTNVPRMGSSCHLNAGTTLQLDRTGIASTRLP